MGKILGLDLGTNSIGWAVIETDNKSFSLKDKGVHIFSEGVKIEKGKESSRAAERTIFRSARRIKFRRKLRKIRTLKVLIENKMCPLTIDELNTWKQHKKAYPQNLEFLNWLKTDEATNINPYYFRDKASKEKLPLLDLGRAFYHLSQRRGFLSNRLDQGDDGLVDQIRGELLRSVEFDSDAEDLKGVLQIALQNYSEEEDKALKKFLKGFEKVLKESQLKSIEEMKVSLLKFLNKTENLGAVKKGIAELTIKIKDAGCETLGQYFYKCYREKQKIRTKYTSREAHYLSEFNRICEVQQLSETTRKNLENAIFYQRPLKSQRGLVGKCSFEKNKPRCPISHPAFEEYRALQFINSIKATDENGEMVFLSEDEREKIWHKFTRKSKPNFDFEDIAKELTSKGRQRKFNYKNNHAISGCPTIAQLKSVFGDNWKDVIYSTYTNKQTKKGAKSTDEVISDIWHVLFTFDKDEKLEEFAKIKLGLDAIKAKKFSKIVLRKDYASLSLKAINKILPYLHEGLLYSYAVFLANIDIVIGSEIWDKPENQKIIRNEIRILVDNHTENKKREGIVNDLIAQFREKYNNSESDYILDEQDKKDVKNKILAVYGNVFFPALPAEEQNEIISWIENKYVKQLRKYRSEFIKPKRLDEKISDFLHDNFNVSPAALEKLYHPSDIEIFKEPKRNEDGKIYLGSPVVSSIKNPMAMRTMHQLRKVVNTLIKEEAIDEETKIHIELARELNDANKRKAIQDWQKDRQNERNEYKEDIKKLYKAECNLDIEPSEDEILKFQLWKEQSGICLYTGKSINICNFIGGNPLFDIEHTIPKSLGLDNSQENLTLCDVRFNREEKRNKLPSELSNHNEILLRLAKWEKKIKEYEGKFNARKKAKGTETKEQKDKRIREKHYYKLYLDYWKGKYNRFNRTDVPEGFKNSQLVDTGIITKYARAYLNSVFNKVYSVKGSMTAEFRKAWGLQNEYEKKERINHIHHCIDAITIACMTKDKYDALASAWGQEDEGKKQEAKKILEESKPWATFAQDLKAIENGVLISHHTPDSMKKQAKKKLRKRGKIQYGEDRKPIYQQGDSVRGSLHKETFYGAIIKPHQKDDLIPKYVVRKKIDSLTAGDLKNIVDPVIQSIIQKAVDDKGLSQAVKDGFFMESGVPINKVRTYAPTVTKPIFLKGHKDRSRFEYKQNYHVMNDGNYLMAIYEGMDKKGKIIRDFKIVNTLESGEILKLSNKPNTSQLVKPFMIKGKGEKQIDISLKATIKKGTMVLFYKDSPEEIWELEKTELNKRLYKVQKFDDRPWITLRFHQESRSDKEIKENISSENEIGSPQLAVGLEKFKVLVQDYDFISTPTGKIERITRHA